jgi:Na+/H+ antiporter NhaC
MKGSGEGFAGGGVCKWRVFVALVVVLLGTIFVLVMRPEWLPVWPSVVAIGMAVATRRVLLALAAGGLSGTALHAGGDFLQAGADWLVRDVAGSVSGSWKVTVILVTLLMGGFAALMENSGVLSRFFSAAKKSASPKRIEATAFLSGVVCFFDGLANSLLVGRMMRGVFDRAGVARVRLAYIADSTASPVACVALASTWIAYQLAVIKEGTDAAGVDVVPYGLFLASWPAVFYCWASLLCVGLFVFTRWDVGPMAKCEAARSEGPVGHFVLEGGDEEGGENFSPPGLWRFWVPLLVLLVSLVGGLWWDGFRKLSEASNVAGIGFADAVGAADAASVLLVGTVLSCAVAWMCFPVNRTAGSAGEVFLSGAQGMLYPVAVLILAWALGSTLKLLGTTTYLASLAGEKFPVFLFPAVVFVVSCVVAFSSGTSWGTMGVLMPMVIPLGLELSGGADPLTSPAVFGAVAAVMSGAVFGDHCSPVSDTTIVAATSSGCGTWEHVSTQMPYAVVAAISSLFFGFIPLGMGLPAWMCLFMVCLGILFLRTADSFLKKKS